MIQNNIRKNIALLIKTKRNVVRNILISLMLASVVLFDLNVFERSGFIAYDLLQLIPKDHSDNIVLVYVDQASIDRMSEDDGFNFPWPREYYGAVVKVADKLNAKAIFFDILFTEPSSYGISDDKNFAEIITSSKLPVFFPGPDKTNTIKAPIPIIRESASGIGGVHAKQEVDGIYRKMSRFLESNNGNKIETISFMLSRELNLLKGNRPYIRFYSKEIKILSFYNVIKAFRELSDYSKLPEEFASLKNKIWMVGYSAPGLKDLRPSPVDSKAPGVFIHASSLANRINGDGLEVFRTLYSFIVTFLLILISLYCGAKFDRPVTSIPFFVIYILLSTSILTLLFWYNSVWLNPVPISMSLTLSSIFYLIERFQKEWKEKSRIADSLEHSMSKEMLNMIKKGDIRTLRFEEKRNVTILFSDIVNFTNISEELDVKKLVKLLDEYYEEIVNLIFENNGYVDKFIGDAVMAVWGAPADQSNHSYLGLQTALNYQRRLDQLNIELKKIGSFPELKARVGLHTGDVIVGNIGSSERFNYTVIGDAVNLASRLEAIGKSYKCNFIMSDEVVQNNKLTEDPLLMLVDEIQVKGKSVSTKIYTYLENEKIVEIDKYKKGFKLYQSDQFDEALELFNSCLIGASSIMASRCMMILQNGKPKCLKNGVWIHDSK